MTIDEFGAALKLLGYTYKRKVMKRDERYWIYQIDSKKCVGRFCTTVNPNDIMDGIYGFIIREILNGK